MDRFFNTTGLCTPNNHYMVEPMRGLYKRIRKLIERHQYFWIHAPRQTGKTTMLHALAHRLNEEGSFTASVCSVESAGYPSISVDAANQAVITSLYLNAKVFLSPEQMPPDPDAFQRSETTLQEYLSHWAAESKKPIVLFMDEADSLWGDVMVSFLRQLRNGFQSRPQNFPASIALVGLRDIREYRMKAKGDNSSLGAGSPFNIKTEAFMLPFFTKKEVDSLLQQHTDDTAQVFPKKARDLIFQYTNGQPWLTNALAHEIVDNILDGDFSKKIKPAMVTTAKENLIMQRQTHLDSLVDKIKEPRVRQVVMSIISGALPRYEDWNDSLRYCRDLGLISIEDNKEVHFSSQIYQEIVTRTLNDNLQFSMVGEEQYKTAWYITQDGALDMDKLLREFIAFYRRHAESWLERFEYREAGHQLLLMAFLQRIVNGGGRIEREMAVGNGRTDLAVFWKKQVIALELKIRHDNLTEEDGKRQINRYLDKLGLKTGYLIIFETKPSTELAWEARIKWGAVQVEDKTVTLIKM